MLNKNWHEIAGVLAGVATVFAYIQQYRVIMRGSVLPTLASWLLWMVSSLLLLASYRKGGADNTIWVPIVYVFGNATILGSLYYKRAKVDWKKSDTWSVAMAVASVIPWIVFNGPTVTLVILLALDSWGGFLMMPKVYDDPFTEDPWVWSWFGLGFVLNVAAIESWAYDTQTFRVAVYPVTMLVVGGVITLLVVLPRIRLRIAKI